MGRLLSIVLIGILLLSSCTPAKQLQHAQRRLNRVIGNYPQLAETLVKDTVLSVLDTDTIYVPERTIDTFFNLQVDTFTVTDSGVTVTVIKHVDRWQLKTVVKRDTIYYQDTVRIAYRDTIRQFKVQPISSDQIWHYRKQGALWLFIAILLLIIAWQALRLYLKGQLPFLKL